MVQVGVALTDDLMKFTQEAWKEMARENEAIRLRINEGLKNGDLTFDDLMREIELMDDIFYGTVEKIQTKFDENFSLENDKERELFEILQRMVYSQIKAINEYKEELNEYLMKCFNLKRSVN